MDRPPSEERRFRSDLRQSSRDRGLAVYAAALVVTVAPLLVGSGPAWAQLLSSALAFGMALLFVLTRRMAVRSVALALPTAIAVALTALQLLPVPAFVVRLLSPRAFELRGETGAHAFLPVTLDVPATVLELSKGLGCLALLLVVGTAARRSSRARPLVLTLAFIGALVGVIHIAQRVLGIDMILGLYHVRDMPGSGLFGTFVNGNQASSLLALSALTAAGVAVESEGALRFFAAASGLLSTGVLITASSRAGAAGLALGLFALAALVCARRFGTTRGLLLAGALLATLGVAMVAASTGLRTRLMTSAASNPVQDQKVRGWQDTAKVILAYPWTGVGRGAFEAPASGLRESNEGVRLVFPENLVLQISSEWGLPAAVLLLVLVIWSGGGLVPLIPKLEPGVQGAACGALAVLAHEMGDFGLELPGVAFPTVAAIALVVARALELRDPARSQSRRFGPVWVTAGMAGWAAALVAGLWAVPHALTAEGQRMKQAVSDHTARPEELAAAIGRHPADYYLELLAATEAARRHDPSTARHLNRAQRLNPSDPNVHLTTARWLASTGRRSQAALEYRLSADRGGPVNFDELLATVGPRHLAEAVPQTDHWLLEVARRLADRGAVQDAIEVSARAVSAGNHSESVLIDRLTLAVSTKATGFVKDAARELLAGATEPRSFVAAAQAFDDFGQRADANVAIDQGLTANPRDASLVIAGARIRVGHDDLTGAVSVLMRGKEAVYTLDDRLQLEELRANIAERRGDTGTATVIRARAKAMARLHTTELP